MPKLIFITLICWTCFSAVKKEVYNAPYGVNTGKYNYGNTGEEECTAVPSTFFVTQKWIVIDDCYNHRCQLFDQKTKDHRVIQRENCLEINHIYEQDSVIIESINISKITKSNQIEVMDKFAKKKHDAFSYIARHPLGYGVIRTFTNTFYFDSRYKQIEKSAVPHFIKDIGVIYFTDKKAMVSSCYDCLRKHVSENYKDLAEYKKTAEIPEVFSFPDSSEWGDYFSSKKQSMKYLGVDTAYNTYWSTESDVLRIYEKTFNLPEYTPEGIFHHKYHEKVKIMFSYDRLGKLRFWFPEPKLEDGWKHYCGEIVVNEQGRIFQMIFYSRINKEKFDKSKGIRILEYIPEKADFNHEGRVKMYGGKKE